MKQYLMVVECAIELENKFLIIKRPERSSDHAAGMLAFPGGKVDEADERNPYAILEHAVKREVYEEVGLQLEDPLQYVTSSYFKDQTGTSIMDVIFYCKLEKTVNAIKTAVREVAEYYWLTYEEVMSAANAPEWLKHYMKQIKYSKLIGR